MKNKEYLITSGIFNIKVKFLLEKEEEDNSYGYYDSKEKMIIINFYNLLDRQDEDYNAQIDKTIIHELTHFFDYNCWLSWSYKEGNEHEHLATFMEIYHQVIQDVLEQLQPMIQETLKEMKEIE